MPDDERLDTPGVDSPGHDPDVEDFVPGLQDDEGDERPEGEDPERSVGELVFDISERLTLLVREEIALAKAEVSEKVGKLIKGSVAGALAALFVVLAFAMLMHTFAWLLNDLFFEGELWLGFLVSALIWLLLAAIAGFFAYRSVRAGAPPVPDMAIEEVKRTGETLGRGE